MGLDVNDYPLGWRSYAVNLRRRKSMKYTHCINKKDGLYDVFYED